MNKVARPVVAPEDQDEVYRAQTRGVTDWSRYRACSQVCRAPMGEPCTSRSGRVIGGRPDGVVTFLDVPHAARKLRTLRPVK